MFEFLDFKLSAILTAFIASFIIIFTVYYYTKKYLTIKREIKDKNNFTEKYCKLIDKKQLKNEYLLIFKDIETNKCYNFNVNLSVYNSVKINTYADLRFQSHKFISFK